MLLKIYYDFLQNSHNLGILFPGHQKEVATFFINVHNQLDGEISDSDVQDLRTIIKMKDVESDFFLFHLLSVIEKAPLEFISKFLKRISIFEKFQTINLNNLDRVYGSIELQKAIQKNVIESSSCIQLYFNLLLLYNHGMSSLDQNSRFIWDGGRYKMNRERRGPFKDMVEDVQKIMEKRAILILDLIISKPTSDEIKELLKYLFPRIEYIQNSHIEKYQSAKLVLGIE